MADRDGRRTPRIVATAMPQDAPTAVRRVTSYDVARHAGVSQSAVSRCFTPGASIAPGVRERIAKIATELGYRPNALAQGLGSRRTNLVAMLVSSVTNLYYSEALAEISQGLLARDMRVLLFSLQEEGGVAEVLDQIWRHSVDGIISTARLTDEQIQMFADRGIPLVLYNRSSQSVLTATVACDAAAGEIELVRRLLGAGHRRFGMIAGADRSYSGEEGSRAALQHLADAGHHDVPVVRGDWSHDSGARSLHELMDLHGDYDAIICANDLMAVGAIDAARDDFGLRVPEDLSIVGFDGAAPATWSSYRVTTIRQPVHAMAEAAVSMLLERVENPLLPVERRLLAGQFIRGASANVS